MILDDIALIGFLIVVAIGLFFLALFAVAMLITGLDEWCENRKRRAGRKQR